MSKSFKEFKLQREFSSELKTATIEEIEKLISKGLNINGNISSIPIFEATEAGRSDVVELLLKRGVSVDSTNFMEKTPLMVASARGGLDMCQLLFKHGANLNKIDRMDKTPLIAAINKGYKEIVEFLLKHGANPNIGGLACSKPMDIALKNNSSEIIALLKQFGAEKFEFPGFKPLTQVISRTEISSHEDEIEKFLSRKASKASYRAHKESNIEKLFEHNSHGIQVEEPKLLFDPKKLQRDNLPHLKATRIELKQFEYDSDKESMQLLSSFQKDKEMDDKLEALRSKSKKMLEKHRSMFDDLDRLPDAFQDSPGGILAGGKITINCAKLENTGIISSKQSIEISTDELEDHGIIDAPNTEFSKRKENVLNQSDPHDMIEDQNLIGALLDEASDGF